MVDKKRVRSLFLPVRSRNVRKGAASLRPFPLFIFSFFPLCGDPHQEKECWSRPQRPQLARTNRTPHAGKGEPDGQECMYDGPTKRSRNTHHSRKREGAS